MKSNKRLRNSLQRFSTKKENKEEIYSGELGIPQNGTKIVEVPNRSGYVYARLLTNKNELIQALNTSVPAIYGLPVQIRRVKNTYTIIGKTYTRYSNQGSGVGGGVIPLPRHGGQHSLNPDLDMGSDTVWVYSRQFMPLLSFPSGTSMQLGLNPAFYQYNNQWYYPQTTGIPSFTPYVPTVTGSARMALYYLDGADNGLKISAGTLFSGGITDPAALAPYIPYPPANTIPLMAVKLVTGTTSLDWNNLYDARPFFQIPPTGTSGGGTILSLQDEGAYLGTASTLNFVGDGVTATISGTVANIRIPGGSSGNSSTSGSATYFRVGQPTPLSSVTGAYWIVPDKIYATGSLGVFNNGHGLIGGIDFVEQYASSGTFQYLQIPPTGTFHLVNYGVQGGSSITVQNNGTFQGNATTFNFGNNLTSSVSGTVVQIDASVSGGGINGLVIQDEGSIIGTGTTINFVGDNISASVSGTVVRVYVTGSSSAASSPWTQVASEDGSSFANFVSGAGVWLSSGSVIRQTQTTAGYKKARYNSLLVVGAIIVEAEIQIKTTNGVGGLLVGYDGGTGNSGGLIRLNDQTNQVEFETNDVAARLSIATTINTNTWYTLRIVAFGNMMTGYLNGTILGTSGISQASANSSYVGLFAYQSAEVWFRNIKIWNLNLP